MDSSPPDLSIDNHNLQSYTLLDFPEEILARIIHFIHSGKSHCDLAQTCSYFRYRVFTHVRQLSLFRYPCEFVERILPKYPNLHTLNIFRGVPDVSSLVHLTNIRSFYCIPEFLCEEFSRLQMVTRTSEIAEWLINQPVERLSLSWKYLSMRTIEQVVQIPTLRIIDNIIHAEITPFITPNLECMRLSLLKNEVPTLRHLTRLRQLRIVGSILDQSVIAEIKHLTTLKALNLSVQTKTDLTLISELPVTTLYLRAPYRSLSPNGTIENLDLTPLRRCLKLRVLNLPPITSAQLEPLLNHPNARKVRNIDNKPYLMCHVRVKPRSRSGSIRAVYNKLKKWELQPVGVPPSNTEEPDVEMPPSNEEWDALNV